jgi:ribosomal protein S25
LSIDDAVKGEIIAPYTINIIEYSLDSKKRTIEAGSKNKKFKTTERANYDYWTKKINAIRYSGKEVPHFMYILRQRMLHTYPSRMALAKKVLKHLTGRTLIFSYQIDQAEELCKYNYHSKTGDESYNLFQKEKIDRLALVNMASVGTTFHNMDNCLVVGTNSKAKNFEQKFCRILIPRDNYEAQVYILCALNTQDEVWVQTAIANLDKKNVNYISENNVENFFKN